MDLPIHNWELLDKNYKYYYRSDRLEIAKKFGFNFISQATIMLYRKYQSTEKVAKLLYVTDTTIRSELIRHQEPLIKRGGCSFNKTVMQTWKKKLDSDKFFLGQLCLCNHNWQNTGLSMRYKKSRTCIICQFHYNKK